MLHITFMIGNPWGKDDFKDLYCDSGMITENKAWEVELTKSGKVILGAGTSITACRDHAGFAVELGILGYELSFKVYDTRHWDYKNTTWEK